MYKTKVNNKNSRKIKRTQKPKAIKGFKAVEWTRKVRDTMYEKNKDLKMSDYVKKIFDEKK